MAGPSERSERLDPGHRPRSRRYIAFESSLKKSVKSRELKHPRRRDGAIGRWVGPSRKTRQPPGSGSKLRRARQTHERRRRNPAKAVSTGWKNREGAGLIRQVIQTPNRIARTPWRDRPRQKQARTARRSRQALQGAKNLRKGSPLNGCCPR